MKKNLTLLTGIAFVIAILSAAGCKQPIAPLQVGPKTVTINVKAVKDHGEKHLEMYDSNYPNKVVIDNLVTDVNPGDTVIWVIENSWRLRKAEKIGPVSKGQIIKGDASPVNGTRNFMYIIPDDAQPGEEKYEIKCRGWLMSPWTIDPHLKVPD